MLNRTQRHRHRGFTLVELLIVVIILAILAAIVVPQFSATTDDANQSSLVSNLAAMRSAIDLYYQQHGEYPSANTAVPTPTCGGTAGAGLVNTEAAFLDQLAYFTDANGGACSVNTGGNFPFGPYLKKRELPANSITGSKVLAFPGTAGDLNMLGDATAAGWKFDNVTGKFIANDQAYDNL